MDMPKVLPAKQKITYLGHAGFMIETEHELILMDPWLSDTGAYTMAWFQYPCNHHLADVVRHKVEETDKVVIVYISHEHQDHFDETFLCSLPESKVMLMLPNFTRDFFYKKFINWEGGQYFFEDNGRFGLRDGYLEFYIHDSIREADSAVLFHIDGFNFLNINDCHIYDRVAEIKERNGDINVLTGSFSGASWFPTCYDYDDEIYATKAKRNKYARFSSLCRLIENIQPGRYVPSAGPPCFLDAPLFEKNFEEENIFPSASDFYSFWRQWRGDLSETKFDYRDPGDKMFYTLTKVPPSLNKQEYRDELSVYRDRIRPHLLIRNNRPNRPWLETLERLQSEMQRKLDAFNLFPDFDRLILTNGNLTDKLLMVDFQNKSTSVIRIMKVPEGSYVISASQFEWMDFMNGRLTWYEWLLSFRFKVSRSPDQFDPILDGFLVNEVEELPAFCRHYRNRHSEETITVHTDSKTYRVSRKCPHESADLSNGWINKEGNLVCSKHSWSFDLENGGQCVEHPQFTINAEETDV